MHLLFAKRALQLTLRPCPASPCVVAIGEIGLDYDREKFCPRDVQMKYFEKQLDLAQSCNLPIIFHNRNTSGGGLNHEKHANAQPKMLSRISLILPSHSLPCSISRRNRTQRGRARLQSDVRGRRLRERRETTALRLFHGHRTLVHGHSRGDETVVRYGPLHRNQWLRPPDG